MNARDMAKALLDELEGATWARYREDRERIVTWHFERVIAGTQIRAETAPRNREYDPERREISRRAESFRAAMIAGGVGRCMPDVRR